MYFVRWPRGTNQNESVDLVYCFDIELNFWHPN